MPTLTLLYTLFLVGIVFGVYLTRLRIKITRRAAQWPDSLYQWTAMPLPSWKYDPHGVAAIGIHSLSVLLLGLLALRVASNASILDNPLFAGDKTILSLRGFIECGSILVVGNQVGSILITFLMTVFRKELLPLAITEKGMGFGQYHLPWRWFSHFSIDDKAGVLRLFSAFAPDLPVLTNKIPDPTSLAQISSLLSRFLPQQAVLGERNWYRSKRLLIPTMLVACFFVVLVSWLASYLSRELALFIFAVLTTALVFLGSLVLTKFTFGILLARNNRSKG